MGDGRGVGLGRGVGVKLGSGVTRAVGNGCTVRRDARRGLSVGVTGGPARFELPAQATNKATAQKSPAKELRIVRIVGTTARSEAS